MDEILVIINKLGGVSFATLLAIILWGNWKHIWVWGKDVDKAIAEMEARHAKEKEEWREGLDFWRSVGIRATGLAEMQGQILKVKETGRMDELNKRLLGE